MTMRREPIWLPHANKLAVTSRYGRLMDEKIHDTTIGSRTTLFVFFRNRTITCTENAVRATSVV